MTLHPETVDTDHSLRASQSPPVGSSRSPRIVTEPLSAPTIDRGLFPIAIDSFFPSKGTISATGLPLRVTTTPVRLDATSSKTWKNFALHSRASMVLVHVVAKLIWAK